MLSRLRNLYRADRLHRLACQMLEEACGDNPLPLGYTPPMEVGDSADGQNAVPAAANPAPAPAPLDLDVCEPMRRLASYRELGLPGKARATRVAPLRVGSSAGRISNAATAGNNASILMIFSIALASKVARTLTMR